MYLPMLFENEYVEKILLPTPQENVVVAPSTTEASPLLIGIAVIVTIVVLLTTIVILLRAPLTIAKAGKSVTTKAADSAIPLITKGRPLPQVQKRRLTTQLVKLMKLLIILLPVALGCIGFFIQPPLAFDLAMLISSILALFALLTFVAQYGIAHLLKVTDTSLV